MGVERDVFIAWSISHGVTCLICLCFFFTKWPALFLSFFILLVSNQIKLCFLEWERKHILTDWEAMHNWVSHLGACFHNWCMGWGWAHHHIVSKVQSFKLENHLIMFECFWSLNFILKKSLFKRHEICMPIFCSFIREVQY